MDCLTVEEPINPVRRLLGLHDDSVYKNTRDIRPVSIGNEICVADMQPYFRLLIKSFLRQSIIERRREFR